MRLADLRGRLRGNVSSMPKELRLVALLFAVAIAVWVATLALGAIGYSRIHALDERILLSLRSPNDPSVPLGPGWLLPVAREFTALGSSTVLLTLILAVGGYLGLERRYGILALVLVSTFGGMAISSYLKIFFGRPRPSVVPHLAPVSSPSFPSGHSLVSAVVYMTLGVLLTRVTTDRRAKTYFVVLAATITFLIGLTRMYVGVHYPTDVLAGWAIGLLWALACGAIARELQRRRVIRPERVAAAADDAQQRGDPRRDDQRVA
jgi:undecaprenyl-diphosphatase